MLWAMSDVVLVAGARPNFMKLAPLLRELARCGQVRGTLVHTGQHYDHDMSGVFFEQLGMPSPDVHLEVGSASHGVQTGRIMVAVRGRTSPRAPRRRGGWSSSATSTRRWRARSSP